MNLTPIQIAVINPDGLVVDTFDVPSEMANEIATQGFCNPDIHRWILATLTQIVNSLN